MILFHTFLFFKYNLSYKYSSKFNIYKKYFNILINIKYTKLYSHKNVYKKKMEKIDHMNEVIEM